MRLPLLVILAAFLLAACGQSEPPAKGRGRAARSRRQQLSCLPKFRQRSEEFLFWLPAKSSSAVQINWRAHVHSSLAAHQRRWQAVYTNQGTATMRYQVLTSLMIN